jgi:hypothetical protein
MFPFAIFADAFPIVHNQNTLLYALTQDLIEKKCEEYIGRYLQAPATFTATFQVWPLLFTPIALLASYCRQTITREIDR